MLAPYFELMHIQSIVIMIKANFFSIFYLILFLFYAGNIHASDSSTNIYKSITTENKTALPNNKPVIENLAAVDESTKAEEKPEEEPEDDEEEEPDCD